MNKRDKRVLNDFIDENYDLLFDSNHNYKEVLFKTAKEYGDYLTMKLTYRFVKTLIALIVIFFIIFMSSRCVAPLELIDETIYQQPSCGVWVIEADTSYLDPFELDSGLSPDQ